MPFIVLLIAEGLHVPVIPLLDVVGNIGAVAPVHKVFEIENVGVIAFVTVTFKVKGVAHWPALGVNT